MAGPFVEKRLRGHAPRFSKPLIVWDEGALRTITLMRNGYNKVVLNINQTSSICKIDRLSLDQNFD